MNQFKKDLLRGQEYEKKALERLLNIKNKIYSFNDDYKYDFIYGKTLYEVKFDEKSKKTNNIFIETMCNNEKSGINKTMAKYYIITDGDVYYKIKTKYIKKYMIDYKYIEFKTWTKMGGYIIPIDKFIKIKSLSII
jgi:hypothetical protein